MIPKVIEYDNHRFYLDSLGKYYIADYYDRHRKKKKKLLHRVMWEKETGILIPKGYVVHHKDHNKHNNAIENFELKTFSQHRRDHMLELYQDKEYVKKNRQQLEEIRPLANEWHRSDDARKLMSERSLKEWKTRPRVERICQQCGITYLTAFPARARFCSRNCIQRHRYKLKIGFEERICVICGKEFLVRKNEKTKTCSRFCGNKYRWGGLLEKRQLVRRNGKLSNIKQV